MIRPSPTRPSRSARSTTGPRLEKVAADRDWAFKPDGNIMRRVVPSPCRSGSSSAGLSDGSSTAAPS